jgi:hypothetical protein
MEFTGGLVSVSPDGMHQIDVLAPLSPRFGGSYTIRLLETENTTVIRHLVVTVPRTEKTVALREGGGAITWDTSGRFADVIAGGASVVRVYSP